MIENLECFYFKKLNYIVLVVFAGEHFPLQALHFAQGQPKIFIKAARPTTTYTTASTVLMLPKIIFTKFRSWPISIPTPTRPQFKPPTIRRIFTTSITTHLQFLQLVHVPVLQSHDIFCKKLKIIIKLLAKRLRHSRASLPNHYTIQYIILCKFQTMVQLGYGK